MKSEFEFIRDLRLLFPAPAGIRGIGDDCAIIPQSGGADTLVSTDMLMEGVHFLRDDITPYQLGWKSGASNFSDIAAMGGEPTGCFLALSVPAYISDEWVSGFMGGFREISEKYGFPLLGGDTTASPDRICICVTVIGKAPSGRSRERGMALPGDLVCVTGTLGDSAAGLDAVLKGLPRTDEVPYLIERHYLPSPRLAEGLILSRNEGVHAMIDISDGLGSDLRHILDESGVGAEVDTASLPLSEGLLSFCRRFESDPLCFALSGGEDYELLFTVDASCESRIEVPHTVIGRITSGRELKWRGASVDYRGFNHFRKI